MKNVMIRLAIPLFCGFLGTDGQAETTASGKAGQKGAKVPTLSAELQDEVLAASIATYIVEKCGRRYTIDVADVKALDAKLEATLRQQGFNEKNPTNIDAAISKSKIRNRALSYFYSRNLRDDDGASLCAAGQAEIAQKTRIGEYLVRK